MCPFVFSGPMGFGRSCGFFLLFGPQASASVIFDRFPGLWAAAFVPQVLALRRQRLLEGSLATRRIVPQNAWPVACVIKMVLGRVSFAPRRNDDSDRPRLRVCAPFEDRIRPPSNSCSEARAGGVEVGPFLGGPLFRGTGCRHLDGPAPRKTAACRRTQRRPCTVGSRPGIPPSLNDQYPRAILPP